MCLKSERLKSVCKRKISTRVQVPGTFCYISLFSNTFKAVKPCPASCFYYIFCHLKLEMRTQFPALNDKKYLYFLLNIHLLNWIIWLTMHLPPTILSISVTYYLAGQGQGFQAPEWTLEIMKHLPRHCGSVNSTDIILGCGLWWSFHVSHIFTMLKKIWGEDAFRNNHLEMSCPKIID